MKTNSINTKSKR